MALIVKTAQTISANETWTSGNTYEIQGQILINGDSTLTIEEDVVIKSTAGGGFIPFLLGDGLGYGILDVNGIASSWNYFVSEDDDTVGVVIGTSSGTPTKFDVDKWVQLAHISSRFNCDYSIIRHAGATTSDYVIDARAAGSGSTFTSVIFEHCGSSPISDDGSANTFCNATDITLRQCLSGTNGLIEVATGQITDLKIYDCDNGIGSTEFHNVYFKNGNSSFVKNARIHCSYVYISIRIDNDSTAKVYNVTATGNPLQTNSCGVFGLNSTIDQRYNIFTGMRQGSYQVSGTINSTFNDCCYNTENFKNTSKGAGDVEIDPKWDLDSTYQYILASDSPLHVATPDKVNDSGFEYALGRIKDGDLTELVALDNMPFGYLYKAPIETPAVDIDVETQLSSVRAVSFTTGDTVQVVGSVESSVTSTGVTVSIIVKDLSTDATIATLYSGTTSLTASTPKSFTSIAGGALTWTSTQGDRYIDVSVSGGTPSLGINVDNETQFAVNPATVSANQLPFNITVDKEKTITVVVERE
jgi:hypothetical protein